MTATPTITAMVRRVATHLMFASADMAACLFRVPREPWQNGVAHDKEINHGIEALPRIWT